MGRVLRTEKFIVAVLKFHDYPLVIMHFVMITKCIIILFSEKSKFFALVVGGRMIYNRGCDG
jgi:hypothetical protein